MMRGYRARFAGLLVVSSGMLLATGCTVGGQVLETIALAFGIVDVWV
jgi:hypothetical protein